MKSRYNQILLFLTVILNGGICRGQNIDLGSWNIVNIKYNANDKLGFFVESQIRSLKFYNHFHYYEYKGGIIYKVHSNIKLTIGVGDYDTYKEGGNFVTPKNSDELRLWPQLELLQSDWNLKIEHRYRVEFRFINNGYRNRFRYRLNLSYPFGKDKNGDKPFKISLNDEIFFTDKEPYFERNRISFSFGYKASKEISLSIGYLYQFDYKIMDETGRDFLQLALFFDLYRRHKLHSNE